MDETLCYLQHSQLPAIKDYGQALLAAQSHKRQTLTVAAGTEGTFGPSWSSRYLTSNVVGWLSSNYEANAKLAETVVLELTKSIDCASSLAIDIGKLLVSFKETERRDEQQFAALFTAIANRQSLIPSAEIRALSEQVAALQEDTQTIDEWAETLARDTAGASD
jgi:hypothetical protein